MKLSTTFKFYNDNDAPYFAAYKVGSLTNGEPTIMFCMDAAMQVVKDDDDKLETFLDIALSTITHEFCHAMQEWLGKEFDELEVEKILGAYNERWNVFNAEPSTQDDQMVFGVNDFLEQLESIEIDGNYSDHYHLGAAMMKAKIKQLFAPMVLWKEAFEKDAEEKNK